MRDEGQLDLIGRVAGEVQLPGSHAPEAVRDFAVRRIVLCKGSLATRARAEFVRRICAVYPDVPVEERLDIPHNRVRLDEPDAVRRLWKGKRTLVFGAVSLNSAVWQNRYQGGMYPHEWFFSAYGFCAYACAYCYLNATPIAAHAPAVRVYVNLPEIAGEISRQAEAAGRPAGFYLGKMQDGLALDPLTGYARVLVDFFRGQRHARQVIQTKSANVKGLLGADHGGRTALAWTLTPEAIVARYECNAPTLEERLAAMAQCAEDGYPVCANIAPVIPEGNWEDRYFELLGTLLERVPVRRIYWGGIYLKRLSLRFFQEYMGLTRNPVTEWGGAWERIAGGGVVSYRRGFAEGFYRRVTEYLRSRFACRFDRSAINGGSLVVRFRRDGSFRVFPDCAEGGGENAST